MNKVSLVLVAVLCCNPALGKQYTHRQNQVFTPSDSTGEEVLKELGVDLNNEGKPH